MKLGKLAPKQDPRTLQLRGLLPSVMPDPPAEYDVDFNNEDIWPLSLSDFGNLDWGDCVIAGRANQFMRFEKREQGIMVQPSIDEVLNEYWQEQGGDATSKPDNGLYLQESLNCWRHQGWTVGGKTYNIHAFAKVNHHYQKEIMLGVYLLMGLYTGVMLREADMDNLKVGKVWTISDNDGQIVGGHCMYMIGYTRTGPVYLTWGQRQVATWDWAMKRMDEAYGVIDNRDDFLGDKSPLDLEALDNYLQLITAH
jgi:hypothetical protein